MHHFADGFLAFARQLAMNWFKSEWLIAALS